MACEPIERTRVVVTHDDEPYRDVHGKEVELGQTLRFLDTHWEAEVIMWNGEVCLDFGIKGKYNFSFYVWMHDEYEVVG